MDTISSIADINAYQRLDVTAQALKAISHPLRLKILCLLGNSEVCVQDIVNSIGTSQSNISQHLAVLRDKNVLLTRKDAHRVFYRLSDTRILELIALAAQSREPSPSPGK